MIYLQSSTTQLVASGKKKDFNNVANTTPTSPAELNENPSLCRKNTTPTLLACPSVSGSSPWPSWQVLEGSLSNNMLSTWKKTVECECKIPLIKQSFLAMDKYPILDNVAEFLTFNSNQKPSRAARPAAMRCSNFGTPFRCWYFTCRCLELANCRFLGSKLKGVV